MKMLPPSVVVTERKRGRPSFASGDVPPADVHLTLPPEDYDRAAAIARRERKSIQQVIREALTKLFQDERG